MGYWCCKEVIYISISFYDWCIKNKPKLLEEWDYEENNKLGITPQDITYGSGKVVWWYCKKGHKWQTQIVARTKTNLNCPYCSNQKVLTGYNDLATTHPEIAKQWHPTKNGTLKPTDITAGSHRKVWWVCKFGHEYKTHVYTKSQYPNCPHCSFNGTSQREKMFLFYLSKYGNTKIKHKDKEFGFELDIYMPELKIGIEYDGSYFHNDIQKDLIKNKKCKNHDIKLFRIRENPLPMLNDSSIDINYSYDKKDELETVIKYLIKEIFNKEISINIDEDSSEFNNFLTLTEKENSIAITHPHLIKEWHPTKNGVLKPTDITFGTHRHIWWQCDKGHEWCASVANRATKGRGCPYCSNQKILTGYNDLATIYPEVAKQWHPIKNGNITPETIAPHTHKKFWWIDEQGNDEYASANNKVKKYKKHKPKPTTP